MDEHNKSKSRFVIQYGLAAGAVALGLLLRLGLTKFIGPNLATFITFYPAVMIVALLVGFGPGLLATFLSAALVAGWVHPAQGRGIATSLGTLELTFFLGMGLLMSAVARLYRRARQKAAAYDKEQAQRESQEAIRKNESRLRRFYESGMLGVFYWNMDGRITEANDKFLEIVGYSREDLDRDRIDWRQLVAPEYWEQDKEFIAEIRAEGVSKTPFEKEYLRKDGRRVPIIIAGAMLDEVLPEGVAFVLDITERKQAEKALKKAYDELETRVEERTSDLAEAFEKLRIENIQRRKLEDTLRESEQQVRFFASQVLSAQEKERRRIATEVHDVLGSSLSAIKFKVEESLVRLSQEGNSNELISQPLSTLIPLIKDTIEEARRIQADLRPPLLDDLGLVATFFWFCRRFKTIYSGIEVEQAITVLEEEIPEHLKIVFFRIAQEAMNNIIKHGKAESVFLGLNKSDGFIELCIKDNGEGFDPEGLSSREISKKGLGLTSMKERAELSGGSFSIDSVKGKGTVIRAVWPL